MSGLQRVVGAARACGAAGAWRAAPRAAATSASRWAVATPLRCFSAESISVKFVLPDGAEREVAAKVGDSLLDVAQEHDIDIEGACGGEMACSTCHVILEQSVYEQLDEPEEEEEDMLDLALGLTDTSRLGCQVFCEAKLDGMVVRLPDEVANYLGDE
mmetsp:Transcript_18522/g.65548  ORF Transcript_18522/g.65548 Transcript_18522/m.65548 type:complete len:158 (-) Transcript_18522:97-570(-)